MEARTDTDAYIIEFTAPLANLEAISRPRWSVPRKLPEPGIAKVFIRS
jgi:hypothetical protein